MSPFPEEPKSCKGKEVLPWQHEDLYAVNVERDPAGAAASHTQARGLSSGSSLAEQVEEEVGEEEEALFAAKEEEGEDGEEEEPSPMLLDFARARIGLMDALTSARPSDIWAASPAPAAATAGRGLTGSPVRVPTSTSPAAGLLHADSATEPPRTVRSPPSLPSLSLSTADILSFSSFCIPFSAVHSPARASHSPCSSPSFSTCR